MLVLELFQPDFAAYASIRFGRIGPICPLLALVRIKVNVRWFKFTQAAESRPIRTTLILSRKKVNIRWLKLTQPAESACDFHAYPIETGIIRVETN